MFPNADQIAQSIVSASRCFGEDPIDVVVGIPTLKSRHVAMQALRIAFPDARRVLLAKCLGYPRADTGQAQAAAARHTSWWNDLFVDEVVGALVANQYGEQAL